MKFARAVRRNTARLIMKAAHSRRKRGGYKMPFNTAFKIVNEKTWRRGPCYGRPPHAGPLTVRMQRAQRRIDFMSAGAAT